MDTKGMYPKATQKALNVHNVMKQTLVLCSLVLSSIFCVSAQSRKYIMLDMLDSACRIERYTLNTEELYGTDHTIEMYNVWHRIGLVLISVLPDFRQDGLWEKLDTSTVSNQILSYRDFDRAIRDKYFVPGSEKKTMGYSLIKQVDNDFYACKNCLLEYFNIRDYPPEFHATYGTINIGQSKLTIREMKEAYKRHYSHDWFPLDLRDKLSMGDQLLLRREYLSKELEINGEKAYQFWTFIDWNVSDGMNVQRGIDRFIYLPGKGIVGGSYDFYFAFRAKLDFTPMENRYTISMDQWMQNILDEKVMLAEELK